MLDIKVCVRAVESFFSVILYSIFLNTNVFISTFFIMNGQTDSSDSFIKYIKGMKISYS